MIVSREAAGSVGEEATADKGGSPANPEESDYEQDGYATIAGADPEEFPGGW